MLEVKNIQTYYGNIQAIKGISLEISEGEIITLIGANGAGKTTTLMSISGIVPPKSGEINFLGKSLQTLSPNQIVAPGRQPGTGRASDFPLSYRDGKSRYGRLFTKRYR